jgi:hypothetical protein
MTEDGRAAVYIEKRWRKRKWLTRKRLRPARMPLVVVRFRQGRNIVAPPAKEPAIQSR